MPPVPSSPRVKLRATSRRVPRARSAGNTAAADAAEYEPEPNMKLSRALLAMLLLHVVAVGGVFAFSQIKDHNPSHPTTGNLSDTQSATEAEDAHLPAAASRDTVADAGTRPAVHVVRQGETLTRIANANGVSLEALVAANGAGTFNTGIHPGQQLRLPEKVSAPATRPNTPGNEALDLIQQKSGDSADADADAANAPAPSGKPGRSAADSGQTYIVGKGESPYTIAHKLKVNADTLLKLNGIDDPRKIKPGQKLRIPAKPSEPKAKPPESKARMKA